MKNWKHCTVFGILAIIALVFASIACDDGNEKNDPILCNCEEIYGTTAHLGIDESCNCPATEKPCGCTEQIATLEGRNGTNINIRKETGISVAAMDTIFDNIIAGYGLLTDSRKNTLANNNIEVWIVTNKPPFDAGLKQYGVDYEYEEDSNKFILKIGDNYTSTNIRDFFSDCIDDIPLL